MAYVQRRISKKIISNKSQIIFHIVINRSVKFRYKTSIHIEPELWSEKTHDLRQITKATKLPPATLRKIRMYGAEIDKLEEKILYIIGEFPDLCGTKVATECLKEDGSAEKYWLELALECVADIDSSELSKEFIEKAVSCRLKIAQKEKKEIVSIYELGQQFLAERNLCQRRVDGYNVVFRVMCRYEIFRTQLTGIEWKWDLDAVTSEDMKDFMDYIRNEKDYSEKYKKVFAFSTSLYPVECGLKHRAAKMKPRGENYISCMQKKIKAFWHWMQANGITSNYPFNGVVMSQAVFGTPYYLNIDERNLVAEYDFSEKPCLALQRDIFIFQCLIGCRVGDLYALTSANIVNGVLVYTPHKTKDDSEPVTARVPLSERALSLLNKYKGVDQKGRLFPFISLSGYNDAIKEVLKVCGIKRMVNVRNPTTGENEMRPICDVATSHMARRTFVGNAYKQVKDQNIVSKMSGHAEGSRAFSRYREIDDDTLAEVINAIQ